MSSLIETDPLFYKKFSKDLLKKREEDVHDSDILFFCRAGSHSFNLNVETSDSDYFGVYSCNLDKLLTGRNNIQTLYCDDPDYVMLEAERFCELLVKGIPKVIEPLFVNNYCYQSTDWLNLITDRKRFISCSVIRQYIGSAKLQLFDAMKNKEKSDEQQKEKKQDKKQQQQDDESNSVDNLLNDLSLSSNRSHHKKLYHTVRVLLETSRMINGDEPLVYLTGKDRDRIMDIRLGKSNVESVVEEIRNLLAVSDRKLAEMRELNSLQETCSIKDLSNWIISLRINNFIELESIKPTIKFKSSDFILNNSNNYDDIVSIFKKLMKDADVEEGAHLLMIKSSGSHSHGYNDDNRTNEQKDWFGVYVSKTSKYLSLYPPPTRINSGNAKQCPNAKSKIEAISSPQKTEKDTFIAGIQLFEIGYFLSMLEQGSHRAVECLRSKDSLETPAWKELIDKNIDYNNLNLIIHYWGVAQGNLAKAQNAKLPILERQKLLYHSLRLILNSKNLLENKPLLIELNEFNEQDQLKLLTLKNVNREMNIEEFKQLFNEIKEMTNQIGKLISKRDDYSTKHKDQYEDNIRKSHSDWLIKLRKSLIEY